MRSAPVAIPIGLDDSVKKLQSSSLPRKSGDQIRSLVRGLIGPE